MDAEVTHQIQKALVISSTLLTTFFHPVFFEKKESDELRHKFEVYSVPEYEKHIQEYTFRHTNLLSDESQVALGSPFRNL